MPRRAARLKVEETVDGDVVGNELRDVAAEIRSADRRDIAKLTRTRAMTPVERRRLEASVHERVEPFWNPGWSPSDVRHLDLTLERSHALHVGRGQPVAALVPIDRGVRMLAHEVDDAPPLFRQRWIAR